MGLLCCGRNAAPPTPPAMHSPAKIPKLIRRRSAPRPRASKQDIEIFYREGKELFRAEQEEIERSRLRKIWRQERQEVLYDEDAADIASILNPISLAKPLSPLTEGSSLLEYSQNVRRRFSFEGGSRSPLYNGENEGFPYENLSPNISLGRDTRYLSSAVDTTGYQNYNWKRKGEKKYTKNQYSTTQLVSSSMETMTNDASGAAGSVEASVSNIKTNPPAEQLPTSSIKLYMIPSISGTIKTIDKAMPIGTLESNTSQVVAGKSDTGLLALVESKRSGESLITNKDSFSKGSRDDSNTWVDNFTSSMDVNAVPAAGSKKWYPSEDNAENEKFYSPEEILSHIRTLIKPSTSTFMSAASSSSQVQLQRQYSPISEGETIIHRASQGSLNQFELRKQPSTSTLFIPSTPPRGRPSFRDSTSSFYPSRDVSRCQSLQGSLVDLPVPSKYVDPYSSLSPIVSPRISMETEQRYFAALHASAEIPSSRISNLKFPSNANANASGQPMRAQAYSDIDPATGQRTDWGPANASRVMLQPIQRRMGTLKSRIGSTRLNTVLSRANSPDSRAGSAETEIALAQGGSRAEKQNDGNIKLETTAYRKARDGMKILRSSFSIETFTPKKNSLGRHSPALQKNIHQSEGLRSTEGSSELTPTDSVGIIRSKSLTLRKSITRSMLRIKSRVSLTGGTKDALHPRPSSPQAKNERLGTARRYGNSTIPTRDRAKEFAMSRIEFEPSMPKEMLRGPSSPEDTPSDDSKASMAANGNMVIRRVNTTRSLPSSRRNEGLGRRSTSTSRIGMKRRSTIYDDCVIFPFTDGQVGDEGTRTANFYEAYHTPLSRPLSRAIWNPWEAS